MANQFRQSGLKFVAVFSNGVHCVLLGWCHWIRFGGFGVVELTRSPALSRDLPEASDVETFPPRFCFSVVSCVAIPNGPPSGWWPFGSGLGQTEWVFRSSKEQGISLLDVLSGQCQQMLTGKFVIC